MKLSQCLRIFELFISMSSFLRYFEQSKRSKLMVGYCPVHINVIIDNKNKLWLEVDCYSR
jgi:hypothetical protein